MKDEFHELYKNAVFRDDIPWNVWKDAWNACTDHNITLVHNRVVKLLEEKKDSEALELQIIMNQMLESKSENHE